jgi:YidC/Oxa1 family membrane protein insertase
MIEFFKVILYEPLLNLLVFFYNIIPGHDLGLAIIFLTLLIKLIFIPLSRQSIKAQKSLRDLQPELEEIKKKYADQKEKQARVMMDLYRQRKVSPFSSCLPMLIQLPILIAVFQVFRVGLTENNLPIYSFISNPGTLNIMAFGILDLSQASPPLALITGVLQYLQMKILSPVPPQTKNKVKPEGNENMMSMMNKQMRFMMPALTVFIGLTLPSGLILYWLVSLLFTIIEQKVFLKPSAKINSEIKKNSLSEK